MDKNLDEIKEKLLQAVQEVLFLEEQYSDADVVDKLIRILEEEYDI